MRIPLTAIHKPTAVLAALLLLASVSPAKTRSTDHPTAGRTKQTSNAKHSRHSSKKHAKTSGRKARGQRAIDETRARQIQTALVREHYLEGEPTGQWDQRTKDAMMRYQAANGWQTKMVPDSRALIKLGLGPSQDNLINPRTAATASVPSPTNAETNTAGGGAFRQ